MLSLASVTMLGLLPPPALAASVDYTQVECVVCAELGAGLNDYGEPVVRMALDMTHKPAESFSFYSEFEAYRVYGIVPRGMSLRYFGLRVRTDQRSFSGVYALAGGPYFTFGGDTVMDSDQLLGLGGDVAMNGAVRLWILPSITGELRADAGTGASGPRSFLEWSVGLENGPWGSFLAERFHIGVRYGGRSNTPWSSEVFDESTLVILFRGDLTGL